MPVRVVMDIGDLHGPPVLVPAAQLGQPESELAYDRPRAVVGQPLRMEPVLDPAQWVGLAARSRAQFRTQRTELPALKQQRFNLSLIVCDDVADEQDVV